MGIQLHVFRRGATYQWRKRLPAALGGTILQISLRTNEPLLARRLALIVGAESCRLFEAMAQIGLTREEVRQVLVTVIEHELDRIRRNRANAPDAGAPQAWQASLREDWAMGYACTLIAARGSSALPLSDLDREHLNRDGRTEEDIAAVERYLAIGVQAFSEAAWTGLNANNVALMKKALNRDKFSQSELNEGRQLMFQGRGAAFLKASESDLYGAQALGLVDEIMETQPVPTQKPDVDPKSVARQTEPKTSPRHRTFDELNGYDPAIMKVADRLLDSKKRRDTRPDTIIQMRRVYAQFGEVTGILDIRDLKQADLARYVDFMHDVPKTYRKSAKDREKTLQQILEEAKWLPDHGRGLSAVTINRNLGFIKQLVARAQSEGFLSGIHLNLTQLRERKAGRDRNARHAFTAQDVQDIFTHPIWHGWKNKKKWHEPGPNLVKDGLYWVPMIAAFTGARREEIAALKVSDVVEIDGIPCFKFHENENRSTKTYASDRDVPLHPQLIEQGLLAHIQQEIEKAGPNADVFPDLKPNDGSSGRGKRQNLTLGAKPDNEMNIETRKKSFGDQIDDRFRKLVTHQIKENREKKVFHSFRHYLQDQLRSAGVPDNVINDIIGHVGDSLASERYGTTVSVKTKLEAIIHLLRLPL